jgi:protein gp37
VFTFTGIPTITSITYITESFKANALELMHLQDHKTFISIEPILGMLIPEAISFAAHAIIGAMTGPGAKPPESSWINDLQHPNIHFKDNILKYIQ